MAQCKCRQCGAVSSAKDWSARKEPACPSVGHSQFSISFERVRPPVAVQEVQPGQLDALGRRKKVIRLESFNAGQGADTAKTSFRERMRAYQGQPGKAAPDED